MLRSFRNPRRSSFPTWLLIFGLTGALALLVFLSPFAEAKPDPGLRIRLARATFDPLASLPDLPDDLMLRTYPAGVSGTYLIQFDGPIQAIWKDEVRRLGVQLFDYIPDYTFLAWMEEATAVSVAAHPHVRWVGLYQPAYRLNPQLDGATGKQTVTLLTFPIVNQIAFRARLEALGASVHDVVLNEFSGYFRLTVDAVHLPALAHVPLVTWITPYVSPRLLNDVARGPDIINAERVWQDLGLYGEGQIVGVCDSGLDVGVNDSTMHDDFKGRIVALYDLWIDGADDRCSGHGTHVTGSLLGNGVVSGSDPANHDYANSYAGLAPEAQLLFQAVEWALLPPDLCLLLGIPADLNTLFQQAFDDGARIHTNSWGGGFNGEYAPQSQQTDQFAWNNKGFTILFAAGNSGVDADEDGIVDLDAIGAPGTAKNCITVGASENNRLTPSPNPDSGTWSQAEDQNGDPLFPAEPIYSDNMADEPWGMAAFSSRGPTDDGRIKPDVVAPGTWVLSVYSQANHPDDGGNQYDGWGDPLNRWYKYLGGTSMATPLTAGAATIVRDYYNDIAGLAIPSSALIKATLINGAYDLTPGQYGAGVYQEISGRPDNVQGWGRVDLANSLIPDPPRMWWYDDHNAGLSTGDVVTYTTTVTMPLTVFDSDEPLRVSLVWTDYPGTPAAGGGLVNDLDLEVIGPDDTHHYGNGVTLRQRPELVEGWDRTNNVEGVDILTPTLGIYTVVVHAYNVAQEVQPYALVVSGALGDAECEALDDVTLAAPGTASVGWRVPLTATVTPSTATLPIGYSWAFGDGLRGSGTSSTTSHVYGAVGLYTAVVTATNCGGSGLATDSQPIEIFCNELSDVALLTDSPVELGQSVAFSATVTPSNASRPISHTWDFGDGLGDSGSLSTAGHVYALPGLYTATLTATNCGGRTVVTDEALVEVTCTPLTGLSVGADDPVLLGQPMQFQATVTPMNATWPISYTWDFGVAGSGSGLNGPSPVFTYTEVGTHTVVVTAANCAGTSQITETLQVVVQDTCHPLVEVTVSADAPVPLGQPMHFQTIVTPTNASRPISYTWGFGAAGSGSGLDGPSPVFTYTEVGTHTIAVAAANCAGAGLDVTQIEVGVICEMTSDVDFSWGPQPVYVGAVTTFTASVGGGLMPLTYTWHFGDDGSRVTEWNGMVSHTFSLSSTVPVTLTVANPCGSAEPVVHPVTVESVGQGPQIHLYLPLILKQP